LKRSKHSLSNYKLLTCDMGKLVPIGVTEVLPGDTFRHSTSLLIRTVPLVAPVMHPVHVKVHHFFVPTRIIWEDFEKFITGGPDGEDASVAPTIDIPVGNHTTTPGAWSYGGLADYLGVPPTNVISTAIPISALPFRAYAMIFNEYYRDQDLVTPLALSKASGADVTTSVVLQNVAWEKDYFTTARPDPQKGPGVTVPVSGGTLPVGVNPDLDFPLTPDSEFPRFVRNDTGVDSTTAGVIQTVADATDPYVFKNDSADDPGVFYDPRNTLVANAPDGEFMINVADLRRSMAIQRYEEARSMYGSRYTEYLKYLGIRSSDARLQRPEYLGGGKQTIQFSEVLQTTPAEVDEEITDVGTLRGHGIGAVRSNRYQRFFEEHGFVISLMSVRPRAIYGSALPKTFRRPTKFDYFQKELMHLGQQSIYAHEVALAGTASMTAHWGYQDRYDDYRRVESTVAGQFRSGGGLEYWHMARLFGGTPTLNASFVTMDPTDRIYAETTSHELQVMASHNIKARRIVPKFAKPMIM